MNTCTPIVLFTYKRLDPLKKTILYLRKNSLAKESVLYIYSDGPKNNEEESEISNVRDFLKTIEGFKSVIIQESKENKGLAISIIQGVTEVLNKHDSVIVLEDDLYTQPNFLSYMNASLDRYRDEKQVLSVCGFSFDLNVEHIDYDAYFLNRPWPWGWAIWKDRWVEIDWDVKNYESFKSNRNKRKAFSKLGSDVNSMLDKQMAGQLDSWAIRWTYHQFCNEMISVFPKHSLVFNGGFDEFATHTKGSSKRYIPVLDKSGKTNFQLPRHIMIDRKVQSSFLKKMSIKSRIISKFQTLYEKYT